MRVIISITVFFILGCSSQKILSDSKVDNIRFGGGGGFTGHVDSYKLNSKGQLTKGDSLILKLKKKDVVSFFNEAKELLNYDYKKYGNLYSFIEITGINTNYIVWSFGDLSISANAKNLHKKLNTLLKPIKKK